MKEIGPKLFKFFDMSTIDHLFLDIVKEIQSLPIAGTNMYKVSKEFELLQRLLMRLNNEYFEDIKAQFTKAKDTLNKVQTDIH